MPSVLHHAARPPGVRQPGMIEVSAGGSRLLVSRHGAQVLSLDTGLGEILWTGGRQIVPGEACWGGIPVCWPWFMTGWEREPIGPFHGPARLAEWSVAEHHPEERGHATLVLALAGPVVDSRGGTHPLQAELRLTLSERLRMELVTTNVGKTAAMLEHCFHAYFCVGSLSTALVASPDGFRPWKAAEPLETDGRGPVTSLTVNGSDSRIFSPFPSNLRLVDPVLGREIHLASEQASHLVVWNSGPVRMLDGKPTGEQEWQTQLALEPLRGRNRSVLLPPGESAMLDFEIRCSPLP